MNIQIRSDNDPEDRQIEAIAEKAEADVRYAKIRNSIWFLAFLMLVLCAPAIVLATWKWGL